MLKLPCAISLLSVYHLQSPTVLLQIPRSGLAQLERGQVHCKNIVNSEVLMDTKLLMIESHVSRKVCCIDEHTTLHLAALPCGFMYLVYMDRREYRMQVFHAYVDVHIDGTCMINVVSTIHSWKHQWAYY